MKYTKEAMNTLTEARRNNSNVSQRRFARNIYALVQPGWEGRNVWNGPLDDSTPTLPSLLNHPSEVAIQHLIRRIDTQIRRDAVEAATVTNSAISSRKKARNTRTTRARSRKIGGLSVGAI